MGEAYIFNDKTYLISQMILSKKGILSITSPSQIKYSSEYDLAYTFSIQAAIKSGNLRIIVINNEMIITDVGFGPVVLERTETVETIESLREELNSCRK